MECGFCKRDENEIKKVFAQVINNLKKQIGEKLRIEIRDNFYKKYAEKNGFTLENFEKVRAINEEFLKMKIYHFLGDEDIVLRTDPNIRLLLHYFNNYKHSITVVKTLNDLMNAYLKEPTVERLDIEFNMEIEKMEMDIQIMNDKEYQAINEMLAGNRIYHGYFSNEINFTLCEFEKQSNYIDIALCPHCLSIFNISIADAVKAENEMKRIKSLLKVKKVTGVRILENQWLPRKRKS